SQRPTPTADLPESTRWIRGHEPFPVRAESDTTESIGHRMSHLPRVGQAPDLDAVLPMTPRRQPSAIGADRHIPTIDERTHRERPFRCHDGAVVKVGLGYDPAGRVRCEAPVGA